VCVLKGGLSSLPSFLSPTPPIEGQMNFGTVEEENTAKRKKNSATGMEKIA